MIFSSKSQMIHVISEVVVLIGFTFYFTSKLNKLSDDLVKTNQVIKSQNDRINYLENMVKHILNKVNKPVQVASYQKVPVVQKAPEIKKTNQKVTHEVVSTPIETHEIQNQEILNEEEKEETLNNTLDETFDTIEKPTQEEKVEEEKVEEEKVENTIEENTNSSEEDLDKELEAELAELKEEEEKLE